MEIIVILLVAVLIYLLQGNIYKHHWHKGLSLSLQFQQDAVFEGERTALVEVLSNKKRLPLPWLTVKYQVSRTLLFEDSDHAATTDYYYRNDLFSITMRQRITRTLPFVCSKRGYYTIKSADLITSNLLGTEKYVSREPTSTYLTVFPALADLSGLEIPFGRISGSLQTLSILNPDPFAFRGIREYLPTDTLRQVNFKASAKTGMLMSNEYHQTLSQELVVILNLEKNRAWSQDIVYEYAIRLAAAVTDFAVTNDMPIRLCTNGRDQLTGEEATCGSGSGAGQLYRILEALARVDLKAGTQQNGCTLLENSLPGHDREAVYILISPYFEKDLQEAYACCAQEAFDALWLIPYHKDEPRALQLADASIIPWEVES